ncbi:MAG: FHA domain-containing protein [Desulfosarcinaceae bacterium]|nr:FHA domain-containing protein [Desulfosarcinaceae bacterium]
MVIDYTIEILSGERAGERIRLNRRRITLGRHPQHNDVVIAQSTVSSRHASITYSQGQYLLEDLGSTNKTVVNGQALVPGETVALHDGSSFRLGRMALRFHEDLPSDPTHPDVKQPARIAAGPQKLALGERLLQLLRWRPPAGRRQRLLFAGGGVAGLLLCLSLIKMVLPDSVSTQGGVPPNAAQDLSQVPIALPAPDVYGFTRQRDRSHPDKVIFEFEPNTRRVVLVYTPGGINDAAEVQIRLNGEVLGSAPIAEKWGSAQELSLPRGLIAKGETNRIEFDHLRNPPAQETWAVRNVSVRLLPEIACNSAEGERLLALGRERYTKKAVDDGNLFRAMTYFAKAIELGEVCTPVPPFLADAQRQFETARQELDTAYNGLLFAYKKSLKLKDYQQTTAYLEAITRLIADTQDIRFKRAQRLLKRLNQALANQRS